MSVARTTAGDTVAAGIGIVVGAAAFFAPALLIGHHGASFVFIVIWAMVWAPASLLLFDVPTESGVTHSLAMLAVHSTGLALLFAPFFFIGRML